MSTCPECRNPYPARPRRHRYAEKAAEELAELKEKRAQILNSWTVLSRKYWNFRDCVSLLPQHKNAKVMITRMFAELGFLKILGNLLKKINELYIYMYWKKVFFEVNAVNNVEDIPFIARLQIKTSSWPYSYSICGASLIHSQFLLTAKHCHIGCL